MSLDSFCSCRIFQQQFCQVGKPVLVRGIRPGFLWDPDTLQRATLDLKGMYGARPVKSARRKQTAPPRPLTVSLTSCCLLSVHNFSVVG